jgi:hypothetical protein
MGCGDGYRERGRFAAATATTVVQVAEASPVVGRACFGALAEFGDDRVIEAAVRAALAKAPGADALANVTIVDEGSCIVVEGTAVRMKKP